MATPTYTLIDSVTLTSSASSVTFSSIDQSYGDLVLSIQINATGGAVGTEVVINSDTGTQYYQVMMLGDGSSADSTARSGSTARRLYFSSLALSGESQILNLQLLDYSATDKHKSILARANNALRATEAYAIRWGNTSAITSIEIKDDFSTNIAAGSTFFLYGIAKAL